MKVQTITLSVAQLEDGSYALALGKPQEHEFRAGSFEYKPSDVYPTASKLGEYLTDRVLDELRIWDDGDV